ncbi:sulfatase [Catenovulum agarivorans DS-2]|uniref:Sulfatase n=1 Tax=Catenovulum agarivorans DS-2 TaxID=1328313 RepID=W7QH44_9ALTE|nr:arylsulfatase [Catenovulum agarivorans]EWH08277.1 sulfatase [Catenovulum agarivorans DS-2]
MKKVLTKLLISALSATSLTLLVGCTGDKTVNSAEQNTTDKPNIVLIMTDDQGHGDLGYHNNPIIQTPNLDKLAQQSVRLTNFHVDPTCSPTRAALLTGKHSLKAGVWHTILGRYMLGPEHVTMAEQLQQNGYTTGIFGKWHLGDNYPYRPQDQGFDEVFIHGGGGVGQTPDYWGNTQFDDTYYRNGKEEKTQGYATTVWFDAAIEFIEQNKGKPTFTFIPLNAPHGPYRAPEEYITPYLEKGLNRSMASFYGMITHIDDQVARVQNHLKQSGELDNTIFIFMTDNGSSYRPTKNDLSLTKGHEHLGEKYPNWIPNSGMRGYKVSVFEGGHRVPFFLSYPNGKLAAKDVTTLSAHYDVLPTLLELAGLPASEQDIDGTSLVKAMRQGTDESLKDRAVVVTNQRVYHPDPTRPTAVAKGDWRYIEEYSKQFLFNLADDPGQQNNVLEQHPLVAVELQNIKHQWWSDMKKAGFKDRYIGVGYEQENPVRLNAMDWMEVPEGQAVPWFIGHQAPADEWDHVHWLTKEDQYQALPWYIKAKQAGTYRIKPYYHDIPAGTPIQKKYCVIDANGKIYVERVWGRASHCVVDVQLQAGEQKISAWYTDNKKQLTKDKAAFYLYIELLSE